MARPALARAAPRAQAQAVQRRAASTQSGGSSGNTTWALGSAAVFGPLLAYILFSTPGNQAAHAIHENIDAKASGERAYVPASPGVPGADSTLESEDKGAHSTPNQEKNPRSTSDKPGQGDAPLETRGRDASSSSDEGSSSLPSGQQIKDKINDAKDTVKEKVMGDKNADLPSAKDVKDTVKEKVMGVKNADMPSAQDIKDTVKEKVMGDKNADTPSAKDVKDSVKQAVSANAPKVAMNSEEKGDAPSASSSSGSSSSGSSGSDDGEYKPSEEEIKQSLKQAESVAVPKAAMDAEAKESHKL